jgi:hypothetical protein
MSLLALFGSAFSLEGFDYPDFLSQDCRADLKAECVTTFPSALVVVLLLKVWC